MRKYFYLTVFLTGFLLHNSYAQDLIVTNVGDSISCLIVRETSSTVQFSYSKYNQKIVREFGKDRISSIVYRFYTERDSLFAIAALKNQPIMPDTIESDTLQMVTEKVVAEVVGVEQDNSFWERWQFGFNAGYSQRLFRSQVNATPYEREYADRMKKGYSFGVNAFYFPWKSVGFGIKYNMFRNKAERDIRTHDDVTIQFLGVSVAHRKMFINNKTMLLSALWVGYQPYKNLARHIGQDYVMKAKTMGWGVSVGIEQRITSNLALSLTGSGYLGNIYKYTREYKGLTETVRFTYDRFEDLSRAEITLGLKFLH
jgi:hypothetical protein